MLIKELVSQGADTQTRLHLFCVQDARLRALERVYEANGGIRGGVLPIPSASSLPSKPLGEEARNNRTSN